MRHEECVLSTGAMRLCGTDEVDEGQMLQARLAGHEPFLVCRQGGEYFVLEDGCTHALASLSEGWLDEGKVLCPLHGGAFDIRTGRAAALPCKMPVRTFDVEIRAGGVWIDPTQPRKR